MGEDGTNAGHGPPPEISGSEGSRGASARGTAGGGGDLYALLGVEKGAEAAEIRKAYHRLALRTHPDKNRGDPEAPARFQRLKRVYAVLSDPARRAAYDKTGSLEDAEDLAGEAFENLYQYYRGLYKEVTADDVEAFEREFRGSATEVQELKELYVRHEGDMDRVFAWLCCSRPEADSHRFCNALEAAAAAGEVPDFVKFRKWAAKVRKRPAPKDPLGPARPAGKKGKKSTSSGAGALSLAEQIKGRQANRAESLLASLEAKYGMSGKGQKKRSKNAKGGSAGGAQKRTAGAAGSSEISEEDFARAAAMLQKKGRAG